MDLEKLSTDQHEITVTLVNKPVSRPDFIIIGITVFKWELAIQNIFNSKPDFVNTGRKYMNVFWEARIWFNK